MKDLYKKIGAIALAGMVVLGGGALAGVQKVDAVSWLEIKVPGERDVEALSRMYEFSIFARGSKEKVDQFIKDNIKKNKSLREKLLKGPEISIKEGDELLKYVEGIRAKREHKKFHRIEYKGVQYLLYFR